MNDVLTTIEQSTRRRVAAAKLAVPEAILEARLESLPPCRDFSAALRLRSGAASCSARR